MSFNLRLPAVIIFCIFFGTPLWGQVLINEICPANGDLVYDPDYFNFSGWVELYNSGSSPVDISGYYLSDDESDVDDWQIPAGTSIPAGGYLIIWCDKENIGLHTNFALDPDGEDIILANPSEVIVDQIKFPKQYTNVSYGRIGNGSNIGYLTSPTFSATNNSETGTVLLANPDVSLHSGRYAGAQTATLSHPTAGTSIRYTTDGSEPTLLSVVYSGAIPVTNTMTLKAKAFGAGFLPSKTEVKTYFINEHNFTLPAISISTNPNFLFSDSIGIYVEGTNGKPGHGMSTPANWNQEWERHAVFEYFDATGDKKFDQGVEIEIGGNFSRMKGQKSFIIRADDKYGKNHINEKLFDNKESERYGGFMYRNSGTDNNLLHFRDALIQHVAASQMDLDYQDYKPTIFYLNGQYWGIQNMREKIDGDYFESNYGISKDDIDLIEGDDIDAIEGTIDAYVNYLDSLQLLNLADPASFSFIDKHIEVQEYINYLVTEIYVANTDWPGNNTKFWRQRSTNGKFRWLLWDLDVGLYVVNITHPTLEYATDPDNTTGHNTEEATLHIRLMLQNPIFKERFINTLATAMSSTFSPKNFNEQLDTFVNRVKEEIPYHKIRWGGTMAEWEERIENTKRFIEDRQPFMTQHMADFFGLDPSVVMLNATANLPGSGTFYVNNTITSPLIGGPYFTGESFTIKALPSTGYTFNHWNISKQTIKPITISKKSDVWKYFDQGYLPASDWMNSTFNDAVWPQGEAEFGYGDGDEKTILSYGPDANNKYITTYFRKTFTIDGADLAYLDDLSAAINFDDGVIVYLNGTEVYRNNMPAGSVDFLTRASISRPTEGNFESFTVDKNLLQAGTNILAIEVHQSGPTSSDLSFDFEMSTTFKGDITETTSTDVEITDIANSDITMEAVFEPVTSINGIVINEINATSSGITDNFGELEDWIELYNNTSNNIDIAGLYVTDDLSNKTKYQLPAGTNETVMPANSYKILWADDEVFEGALHLGFKLSADGEAVGLYQMVGDEIVALAEVTFDAQPASTSFARIPNITGPFESSTIPTAGTENMIEVVSGVDEDLSLHISVYPNPTTDEITITSDALIHQVSLSNVHGMEMSMIEMHVLTGNVSMATLPTGMYFLQLKTEKGLQIVKVLKK